jgi:hypothetical protein
MGHDKKPAANSRRLISHSRCGYAAVAAMDRIQDGDAGATNLIFIS